VCWKGEPVCIARASASDSIFAAAESLKWRLKDASVWPHEYREEPCATAVVVEETVDDDDDAAAAAAAAAADNDDDDDDRDFKDVHAATSTESNPPSLLHGHTHHGEHTLLSRLPPLPRAQKAPVLRRTGCSFSKADSQTTNPFRNKNQIIFT
jgi:hypothetical protein